MLIPVSVQPGVENPSESIELTVVVQKEHRHYLAGLDGLGERSLIDVSVVVAAHCRKAATFAEDAFQISFVQGHIDNLGVAHEYESVSGLKTLSRLIGLNLHLADCAGILEISIDGVMAAFVLQVPGLLG